MSEQVRRFKIVGSGQYLPKEKVSSSELDRRLGLKEGSCFASSGVENRYFANVETERVTDMGAKAAMQALESAGLRFEDLDAIVSTSGAPQQVIPCTSALLQKAMGKLNSGIPSFDINATCLSFVTGIDTISYMMDAGRYKRVMFVSAENSSCSLDPNDTHTMSLFGDGAVAVIAERSVSGEGSRIIASKMETYAEGADQCRLRAGGSLIHSSKINDPAHAGDFVFQMEGRKVVRLALETLPPFVDRLLAEANMKMSEIDLVIPHQASRTGMELIRRKLDLPEERWMDILVDHGNMISVSIPLALRAAITTGRIKRGSKVMLLGTSAGFSVGGVILEY